MLTQIDLNRLRVFYYVFLTNSISGAAKLLNITRPAVSQQLKKLEHEVGVRLFTRLHKGLVPTSEGQQVYTFCESVLVKLEHELERVRQGGKDPCGLLRIGAPIEFGQAHLPKIIADFRSLQRKVTFSLVFGDPERLIEMVRSGQLDFALIDMFLTHGHYLDNSGMYTFTPLFDEEVVLVCSSRYAERELKNDFAIGSLLQADFISYQQSRLAIRTWFRHHYDKIHFSPRIVLTVDSVRAVVTAVESHAGMGVVPSHIIEKQLEKKMLVAVPSPKKEIVNTISVLQLQDKVPSLADKAFLTFLSERIKALSMTASIRRRVGRVGG